MNIARETIDDFFQSNAARGIDLDRQMLWGFFFVDANRAILESLAELLVKQGYRHVRHLPVR